MKVWFGQIYIEPGVCYTFSHVFQQFLSKEITALVKPSSLFIEKYGDDYDIMYNVSAKRHIQTNEIRGPTVFRKGKDVEFSTFLPFDTINHSVDIPRSALSYLFSGIYSVLNSLNIETSNILISQEALIERICSDSAMFNATDSNMIKSAINRAFPKG